ncbi:hypothetical protein [Mycobacterium sp. IDR2000157661]|uniref:hypothetical protein n=1 Tax=Mycobacterium sp. IDR2000157661 TaxID=2867005 RepID=UPI001EEC113E|nr:hypothetical protein [Mycobacterium sp. IDR2000157661]ULE34418.1 hypothetical protein K3G64_07250 [Mycobacterium sp. IDR2000157661]
MSNQRDVEKRFSDPPTTRKAIGYGAAVIVVAGVAFVLFALIDRSSVALAASVPAVLLIGGIGAMVKAFLAWRQGRSWFAWQGTGWFLLTLFLVCLAVPYAAVSAVA